MTDNELKSRLQAYLADAPESPWFTRKVLNRLPPKVCSVSWIEKTVYILSILGLLGFALSITGEAAKTGMLRVGTIVAVAAIGVISIAIVCSIIRSRLNIPD